MAKEKPRKVGRWPGAEVLINCGDEEIFVPEGPVADLLLALLAEFGDENGEVKVANPVDLLTMIDGVADVGVVQVEEIKPDE